MAKNSLWLECDAGISGDMAVAALLDAGADREELDKALRSIPAEGFSVEVRRVMKSGIDALDFDVVLDAEHENHDHDMEYLYGHEQGGHPHDGEHHHGHYHEHEHGGHDHGDGEHHHHEHEQHEHAHPHDCHQHGDGGDEHHGHEYHEHEHDGQHAHDHGHGGHQHHHEHRTLADVDRIIDATGMEAGAKELAHRIFRIVAEAEGKAHRLPVDQVHFHEVGALDSIVDVIALAVCFESLRKSQDIGRVYAPYLVEGSGMVRCQHGLLPIPVPAVSNIASSYGIPLRIVPDRGEFVTPTGAAFVAAVATDFRLPPELVLVRTGIGAGKRSCERTNICRANIVREAAGAPGGGGTCGQPGSGTCGQPGSGMAGDIRGAAGDSHSATDGGAIYKLESNIDDSTGEMLGFLMERLFAAGARDVQYVPCYMKKNRPAYLLSAICAEKDVGLLEDIIFKHTTTIGIRRVRMERSVLEREQVTVESACGPARVKKVILRDGEVRFYPEYEDVAEISRRTGRAFAEIYRELLAQCGQSR